MSLKVAQEYFEFVTNDNPQSKPVSDSQTELVQVVRSEDANPLGVALGGKVMEWMDQAAAVAATRHSESPVVTASVGQLSFLEPIHVGDLVFLRAAVNYTGKTSMEVGVSILCEDPQSGKRRPATRAYLTFVAVNARGQPTSVPRVIPQSQLELQRFEEARRCHEQKLKALENNFN